MHNLRPIPDAENIPIKEGWKKRFSELTNYEEFMKYNLSFLRRSIRVNILKSSVKQVKESIENEWNLTQIPWCREGFWIEHIKGERRDVGNLREHQLGYFYVQEAASMLPPLVLEARPDEMVLDLCASPGSKTSQMAMMMRNRGIMVANDYKGIRLSPLGMNLARCGVTNTIITKSYGQSFKSPVQFDRILVDAPCSGTGTIRKSLKTLRMWNPHMIRKLAAIQKRLITHAYSLLKSGGFLVYSTCSVEPEENEGVVDFLLQKEDKAKVLPISVNIRHKEAIVSYSGADYDEQVRNALRIWPQENDTEGFFVAKILKKG